MKGEQCLTFPFEGLVGYCRILSDFVEKSACFRQLIVGIMVLKNNLRESNMNCSQVKDRVPMIMKTIERTELSRGERTELSPDTLIESARTRKTEIERTLKEREESLKTAPEGKLRIVRNGKTRQYFLRSKSSDKIGIYLKRAQDSLAAALAQKDYNCRLVDELQAEVRTLSIFLNDYHPEHVDEIFRSLHFSRKPLVFPARLLDNDFVNCWKSVAYEKKEFEENMPEFYTANGERVRSKSEILIADTLRRYNIPYKYEYPILLDGLGTVYPDFICLNVRKHKQYVWEHFGMMSVSDYADCAVNRMEKYILAGYYPGENSIMTFETASHPLNTRIIAINIMKFLK